MDEFGTAGMQADAAVRIGAGKTIFQVAFDWASHLGKLATDLVMTACLQVYSQQIIVVRASNHFIMQDRFLGIRPFRVISIALVLLLVANQPVHQLSLFCRRTVLHDRPIGLLYFADPEHLVQTGERLARLGK